MYLPPVIELQFRTDHEGLLIDLVREAGTREGSRWSRRRVATWIGGGCVRVDGQGVRDPRAAVGPAALIDLHVDSEPQGLGAAGHAPSSAPLPILHVDRHLLVVEILPGAEDDLESALRATIDRLGLAGVPPGPLVRTVPADAACTGIVACALTPVAARALQAASLRAEIRLRVAGRTEPLVPEGLNRLVGTPQAGSTPHVVRLELPHPRTGTIVEIDLEG